MGLSFSASVAALLIASAAGQGCLPPHHTNAWCDPALPAAVRAAQIAKQLTIDELVGMMQGDSPEITRLGIPPYHYGYEALHGTRSSSAN